MVAGQGYDSIGHFILKGQNENGSVSFKKVYDQYEKIYYTMYEAELVGTILSGKWSNYHATGIRHDYEGNDGTFTLK